MGNKGIIVIDKVPESCVNDASVNGSGGCPFGGIGCGITGEDVMEYAWKKEKPDWCPIRALPAERKMEKEIKTVKEAVQAAIGTGYNECLKDIREGTI